MWNLLKCLFYIVMPIIGIVHSVPQGAKGGMSMSGSVGMGMARPVMTMPVIMPPGGGGGDVVCSDGGSGYVNDQCKSDSDCMDSAIMTCTNKKCQCVKGFVEDPYQPPGSKRTCVQLPSFMSGCTNACQKPYECKQGNANIMPAMDMSSMKTCQCPGKSKNVNGVCDAGCKPDQRVGIDGECVAKCTKDQIQIDGECKPLVNLGESCSENSQCKAAFSNCINGKCTCVNGFSAKGSKCEAKSYSCPFGDPLKKGGSVVSCDGGQSGGFVCMGGVCPMAAAGGRGAAGGVVGSPPPNEMPMSSKAMMMPWPGSSQSTDSCPSGHYCHQYDYGSGPQARGHCCPKPAPKCPVGEPHPSGTCNGGPPCPYMTHVCLSVGASSDMGGAQLCCPKPCRGYDTILVKDQCLPFRQYGESCQANEQCQQINGLCSAGKCSCPSKAKAIDNGGGNRYCEVTCDPEEVLIGIECKARLKLGDSCSSDPAICPNGAYCNRKGVCECICGYQQLSEKFCAPPPYCPGPNGVGTASRDAKKMTFCKLDGDGKTPASAVDVCPGKFFCQGYVENMGVCCPKPDPSCPDGSKPTKTNCHKSGCSGNEMCNTLFVAATSRPTGEPEQGSVCCPSQIMPMPMVGPGTPMEAMAGMAAARPKGPIG